MKFQALLASVAVAAIPALASAQSMTGLYLGAGLGLNFVAPENNEDIFSSGTLPNMSGGSLGETFKGFNNPHSYHGFASVVSVGYGLGHGFRIEVESDYRFNNQDVDGNHVNNAPNREQKFGGLANVLYDFHLGLPYVYPYLGAGVGYMHINRPVDLPSNGAFAFQGITGIAVPIALLPGLSATIEYRLLGLNGYKYSQYIPANFSAGIPSFSDTHKYSTEFNNSILLGLRYAFNSAAPQPSPQPVVITAPTPAPTRTYLVFFDWDKSDLTDRARQIVSEAAQASTRVQTTRVEVQGDADASGTRAYNQSLSLRRARTVAAELVRLGVPSTAIDIQAFGDTRPLVPTAAGVREPQNRRVAIILR